MSGPLDHSESNLAESLRPFAEQVRQFQRWALESESDGGLAAREALLELLGLQASALTLPSPFLADGDDHDAEVSDEERQHVFRRCARLPIQYCGSIFQPDVVPPEEPVVGDVAADISEIYSDVVAGLRLFDAGHHDEALWEWSFGFRTHWGRHVAAAMKALFCWLADNDQDYLSLSLSKREGR